MAFARNPDKVHIAAEVRVMWPGGPSRRWSAVKCSEASLQYGEDGGYAGSYVCQGCGEPTVGVYDVPGRLEQRPQVARTWVCAECRTSLKPKKEKVAA